MVPLDRLVALFAPPCVLAIAALSVGCTALAPYDRGKLAHPTMAAGDIVGHSEAHVRAVHEGAVGGNGASGSGCGCN